MDSKTTSDLRQELMSDSSIDTYIHNNEELFVRCDISDLLDEIYQKKNISKAALARKASMSEIYLHQIFSGRRTPSRDRLICLCVGLGATLEETQQLLTRAVYAQLYPKLKRDAIIIHGILHQVPLQEINDKLFTEGERQLI